MCLRNIPYNLKSSLSNIRTVSTSEIAAKETEHKLIQVNSGSSNSTVLFHHVTVRWLLSVCLRIKKAEHTWYNIIDMQKKGTFNTCKTAQLYAIVSSIPVSNRIILKTEKHVTCIPRKQIGHAEHLPLGTCLTIYGKKENQSLTANFFFCTNFSVQNESNIPVLF